MSMQPTHNSAIADELRWTMTRVVQDGQSQRSEHFKFDLTELTNGYSLPFLIALKTVFIESRNRFSIRTIHVDYERLKIILLRSQNAGMMSTVVEQIDLPFLAALETIKQNYSKSGLRFFKRFFAANRGNESIFATDLIPEDFPILESASGERGEAIKRILSKALSRAAVAQTLTTIEDAYESGKIDIEHYSFSMLAFQVFFRPESYRQLRLMDLTRNENKVTGQVNWFLDMLPVKTRADNPHRLSIKITPDLGELLQIQREHVVRRYGHLVAGADLNKLALFPARRLREDGTSWSSRYPNMNYGMLKDSGIFSGSYLRPVEKLVSHSLNFNALRHTVGTQLALAGLSASRIASVLKHATNETCQIYVDLFFQGVLDRISDAMQPSFDEHFPVYKEVMDRAVSKDDPIPPEKAIVSEDLVTGRRELTAECGRQSLCEYAPLACYDCNKFRPCWDADHTINLDLVNREIAEFEEQGLAMQHETRKYKELRNAIRVVINICNLKSQAAEQGANE